MQFSDVLDRRTLPETTSSRIRTRVATTLDKSCSGLDGTTQLEGEGAKHTVHSNKWRDGLPGGVSKSFWLVTRELGQTPRGKIATSAVVSFEKPRGRFPSGCNTPSPVR